MPVHLPNENYIAFSARARTNDVLSIEFLRRTMLTQWFVANQQHVAARDLTYVKFPSRWKWDAKTRSWEERCHQQGKIGRLHYVHPSSGEWYYLRMLLLTVKGATSFQNLRYHNGIQHPTFKEACRSHGLLGDDNEWYDAFSEAAAWGTSSQLWNLFVTMILLCQVGDERAFFERVWRSMSDDIQYRYRQTIGNASYRMPDTNLRNYLHDELAVLFGNSGHDIREFNLP